jgi:hypothetical protein
MKRLILVLTILIGISAMGNAQSSPKQKMGKKMEMKNGVMIVDNKAMLCSNYKCTPLTETYTCTDGCKVSTDGTITKPDGSTMKLMNGYQIDKNGKVAMIPHGQKGHVCNEACPMNPNYKKPG